MASSLALRPSATMVGLYMVGVAQLVSAPDCGSGDRGFESHHSPSAAAVQTCLILGYRQGVRHSTLTAAFVGSNPTSPVSAKEVFFAKNNRLGALAQVVEHLTFNQVVRGSSPRCFMTRAV